MATKVLAVLHLCLLLLAWGEDVQSLSAEHMAVSMMQRVLTYGKKESWIPQRPPVLHGPVLAERWVWDEMGRLLQAFVPAGFADSNISTEMYEFLHIPKNAGTAIESAGKAAGFLWGCQKKRYHDEGEMKMPDGNYCSRWHVPSQLLDDLPNPYAEAHSVFCVSRHPYNRLVSEYKYMLKMQGSLPINQLPECSADALNAWVQENIRISLGGQRYHGDCHFLPQADYIWDDAGEKRCNNILRFDNLPFELASLMTSWSLPVSLAMSDDDNGSEDWCSNLNTSSLSLEVKQLVEKTYAKDFKQLGYDPNTVY